MLNFYDFEVFAHDWLVVIVNPAEKKETVIVNDRKRLEDYFNAHAGEIWVGYNNRQYDQYIMKSIFLGVNPKIVSDWIILQKRPGYQFSGLFNCIKMINFDTMLRTDTGLKTLEASMGNSIKETSVPFDIDRKLTDDEIAETIEYCRHDVKQTMDVFIERKAEFNAAVGLVKIFNLPLEYVGKTTAQRVAKILGGKRLNFDDEFDFPIVDTLRLGKYQHCCDWYRKSENQDYRKNQTVMIAGVEHTLAWGGIHGAITKYSGEGVYLMADVTAYYPSLQLRYKFGYRNMGNHENFEKIHNENLRLKATGDKCARLPYKIADNAISGQLKDKFSPLYDPRENNAITVNGQLLLVDLIEKLENHCRLIQSNTDGVLLKLNSISDYEKIDDLVWEWEQRTGMRMEFEIFNKVFQKDVNNYLLVGQNGKIKMKGAYTKELGKLDNDLPVVNEALVNYMVKNVPVETTIRSCHSLIMFQKIVKLSGKYWAVWHNDKFTFEKCYRVFASKSKNDTFIGKCKTEGATIEKFANTPDRCFIENGNVNDEKVPAKLDYEWYIALANDRLRQYGVG